MNKTALLFVNSSFLSLLILMLSVTDYGRLCPTSLPVRSAASQWSENVHIKHAQRAISKIISVSFHFFYILIIELFHKDISSTV